MRYKIRLRHTDARKPHAHSHLERELHPPADRPSGDLAEGDLAGHRLPAGDQVPGRGLPARADRGARLQRGHPRPEDF